MFNFGSVEDFVLSTIAIILIATTAMKKNKK
jgi:hypothetical protein